MDGLGQLVGINSASLSGEFGSGPRMGFAIPANLALKVAADLLEHGRVVRGYLGLAMRELPGG